MIFLQREKIEVFHDSQNALYRYPLGARPTESTVKLSIRIECDMPLKAQLRLWQNDCGETLLSLEKCPDSFYEARLKLPDKGQLIWYYFIISLENGQTFYYGNFSNLGGKGSLSENIPPSFQITVFQKEVKTPAWAKKAVFYQIFPDRFYHGQVGFVPKKGALYHADWQDTPFYFKDISSGRIAAYDFFGGDLEGIRQKLPYLLDLGVNALYLNPIFKAQSNHRYDTADYLCIDPILGTEADLKSLCQSAKKKKMHIILDGVFSHTGSDSIYFNRYGTYNSQGAFQTKESPYFSWYDFKQYPKEYACWWNFDTLPDVKETTPSYLDFIISGQDSVLRHWHNCGTNGWRLDVIDELPQKFSRLLYKEAKKINADNLIIGEVWEDASNKISYGLPREYLCGYDMDSAMNYPLRQIIIDFLLMRDNAGQSTQKLKSQLENYPIENAYAMLNLLGSHDVERILTILGEGAPPNGATEMEKALYRLPAEKELLARERLKLAVIFQFTYPGMPCIYYGDEIGLQGFRDPYNRTTFNWDKLSDELFSFYKKVIALRQKNTALQTGFIDFLPSKSDDILAYTRFIDSRHDAFGNICPNSLFIVILNRGKKQPFGLNTANLGAFEFCDCLTGKHFFSSNGQLEITLAQRQALLLQPVPQKAFTKRASGVLLHISSLPQEPCGNIGPIAYQFIDFLKSSGQTYWQFLPLNPPGFGDSPYQSPSSFAGNHDFISPQLLSLDNLLSESEWRSIKTKEDLHRHFKIAYQRFEKDADFKNFCQAQSYWLDDYAAYMALKEKYNAPWSQWPAPERDRKESALSEIRKSDSYSYHLFLQYEFHRQWQKLRAYAQRNGIFLIGDLPIYPAHDSADTWAHRELFDLNPDGSLKAQAGVPPDYFSKTGQLWGNPLYLWPKLAADDYRWWKERLKSCWQKADLIRLDHFRGFADYWAVDANAPTAATGKWLDGPGLVFFASLKKDFGRLFVIAEDLGELSKKAKALKKDCQFPGMDILQFDLLSARENACLLLPENSVVYTGTHDNNTLGGYFAEGINKSARCHISAKLLPSIAAPSDEQLIFSTIEAAFASDACLCITPIQDFLHLGAQARMNLPGTVGKNWQWQLNEDQFAFLLKKSAKLYELTKKYQRL